MLNVSARKHRLIIGEQNWSDSLLEISNWNSTAIDNSGIVKITATLTLIEVRGLPGSLDDRAGTTFRVGQFVTIDVTNSSGVPLRHPAGALRILSAEYSYEERRLLLQLGCLLTLLSFKQPTEPLEGQEPEEITSSNNSRKDIVTRLLNKAGITNINCPYNILYPINYPIIPQGSYIQTAGAILYSAGFVMWCDAWEVIQIKPVSLTGRAALTLRIGGDAGKELWYRRLTSTEAPREIIKVRGVAKVAQLPIYPKQTVTTHYGAWSSVVPSALNATIVTGIDRINETYDSGGRELTTITNSLRSYSSIYPNKTTPSSYLIDSEYRKETRQFELGDEGKLLSIYIKVYKPADLIEAEYIKAKEDLGVQFPSTGGLIVAEETYISYTYDAKSRPVSVKTIKYETEVAILTGTNQDWESYPLPPTGLVPSLMTTETWSNTRGNEWVHTIIGSRSFCRLKPELITDETTAAQKMALAADDSISLREVSNSGQTVPPSPERCPPKSSFNDRAVCGEAHFSQYGGNPYFERERVYQIDYLEGRVQTDSDINYVEIKQQDCQDTQCKSIAQIEGALLYGRFKGQDLGTELHDELFNWQPLMKVDCIEPDGTTRAFALDDSHWYLGQEKCICNFGCIWLGDRSLEQSSVTVTTSKPTAIGDVTIQIYPAAFYIAAGTTLKIGGIEFVTASPIQPGDTAIRVVSLKAPIPRGATATYTENILKLPYMQVQSLSATGMGRADVVARPYTLSLTTSSLSAASSGTVEVTATFASKARFYWDNVTSFEWNDMSALCWNNCYPGSGSLVWNVVTLGQWNNINESDWIFLS